MNRTLTRAAVVLASAFALTGSGLAVQPGLLSAAGSSTDNCFDPVAVGAAARGATNSRAHDHRDISAAEIARIEKQTKAILAAKAAGKGTPAPAAGADPTGAAFNNIPVYFHQMLSKSGAGRVTQAQIDAQIAELNQDYAGGDQNGHTGTANGDQPAAANTGARFYLAGVDEYLNDTWHKDRQSTTYRSQTRKGGPKSLNIWLVDFSYLGIATFPWDYAANPGIDGIRVQYTSLPGGSATNYNQGKTATHEAGHWLGLYHTFQGGCTSTNDSVADTPAQASSTTGCPEGRNSCSLPGLDPIHNYMDYSYDQCYDEFTSGQSSRIGSMWAAYRS